MLKARSPRRQPRALAVRARLVEDERVVHLHAAAALGLGELDGRSTGGFPAPSRPAEPVDSPLRASRRAALHLTPPPYPAPSPSALLPPRRGRPISLRTSSRRPAPDGGCSRH